MVDAGGTREAAASTFVVKPMDAAPGCYELVLQGRIYADLAPKLKNELLRLAEVGMQQLVVDAGRLEQIDSSGLNVFVTLLKQIRPRGGKITFFGLNENIARVFEITKLRTVMGVTRTRKEAVGLAVPLSDALHGPLGEALDEPQGEALSRPGGGRVGPGPGEELPGAGA